MSQTKTKLLLCVVALFTMVGGLKAQATTEWGGSGTENDPYTISTPEQLLLLATNVNAGTGYAGTYFKVTNNIDMTGKTWTPIGSGSNPFRGHFDGGGYTISHMTYTTTDKFGAGLFYNIHGQSGSANFASVKNVKVDNSTFGAVCYVGGIVANVEYVNIRNCYVGSDVTLTASSCVGGIVGNLTNYSTVEGCISAAEITGKNKVGGIVGDMTQGTKLKNSLYTGGALTLIEGGECRAYLVGNIGDPNTNTTPRTNNFYTNTSLTSINSFDLLACTIINPNGFDFGTATDTYDLTGITAYGPRVLFYNGKFHVGINETVTFTATASESGTYTVIANGNPIPYSQGQYAFEGPDTKQYSLTLNSTDTYTYTLAFDRQWGGSGTESDPYTIGTPEQLQLLATRVNDEGNTYESKHFLLTSDIDMTGKTWTPIGRNGKPFGGFFHGDNKTISNISCDMNEDYVGFFGYLNNNGVEKVTLASCTFKGTKYVGGIAGYMGSTNTTIRDCNVGSNVTIIAKGDYGQAGGIVGYMSGGFVNGCVSAATVKGNVQVGGIVGLVALGTVEGCVSAASVEGETNVGGLVGIITQGSTTLKNCLYTGGALTLREGSAGYGYMVGNQSTEETGAIMNTYYKDATLATINNDNDVLGRTISFETDEFHFESTFYNDPTAYGTSGITSYGSKSYATGGVLLYKGKYYAGGEQHINFSVRLNADRNGQYGVLCNGEAIQYDRSPYPSQTLFTKETNNGKVDYELYSINEDYTLTIKETSTDWDGLGVKNYPYYIKSTADLDLLATRVNAGNDYEGVYFQLYNDLNYSDSNTPDWNVTCENADNYTPIGTSSHPFKGSFDGNDKTIRGIRIHNGYYSGVFGYIDGSSVVEKLSVDDMRIEGYSNVAAIVGHAESGTVENCHVGTKVAVAGYSAGSAADWDYFGGVVGFTRSGVINNCTSSVTFKSGSMRYVGAILGVGHAGSKVSNCLTIGATIEKQNQYYGAIVGTSKGPGSSTLIGATLQNNYYYNCTVNGKTSGIGCVNKDGNQADFKVNDGAVLAMELTAAPTYGQYLAYNSKYYTPASHTVQMNASGIMTYCSTVDLDFTETGLTPRVVRSFNEDKYVLTLADVDVGVPAYVGIMLMGPSGNYVIPIAKTTYSVGTNLLVGVTADTELATSPSAGVTNYILANGNSGIGWYPVSGGTLAAGKAYLQLHLSQQGGSGGAKVLTWVNEGEDITGIDAPATSEPQTLSDGVWYTLNGVRLAGQPKTKGIYIVNGKKVVVK